MATLLSQYLPMPLLRRAFAPLPLSIGFSLSLALTTLTYYSATAWKSNLMRTVDWLEDDDDGEEVGYGEKGSRRLGKNQSNPGRKWGEVEVRRAEVGRGVMGLVANTPLIEIISLSEMFEDVGIRILGKAEFLNPGGSVKDRVAMKILSLPSTSSTTSSSSPSNRYLPPGSVVFEGTSGSTGISLATLARGIGVGVYIVLSDEVSKEKIQMLERLGATVEKVKPSTIVNSRHYVNVARKRALEFGGQQTKPSLSDGSNSVAQNLDNKPSSLSSSFTVLRDSSVSNPAVPPSPSHGGSTLSYTFPSPSLQEPPRIDQDYENEDKPVGIFADQFENLANFQAHFEGTGPEIWKQTRGEVAAFVSGAGTGGTLAGVGTFLKTQDSRIEVVLADPQGSGLYNKVKYGVMFSETEAEGTRRRHQIDTVIEGIGLNRMTKNIEKALPTIDDAYKVIDADAVAMSRHLAKHDGLFLGSSSAVNLVSSVRLANRWKKEGKRGTIVTVLCDHGTRHTSRFWDDDRLKQMDIATSSDISHIVNGGD